MQSRVNTAESVHPQSQPQAQHVEDISVVATQVKETFKEYARERPDVVALWCVGIGFVLGWKMKPW